MLIRHISVERCLYKCLYFGQIIVISSGYVANAKFTEW